MKDDGLPVGVVSSETWFSGPTLRRVLVVSSADIPRPTRFFIIILRIRASELFFHSLFYLTIFLVIVF